MNILHIIPSEPDEFTQTLIDISSQGVRSREIKLNQRCLNYDQLVSDIFSSDKVITWW